MDCSSHKNCSFEKTLKIIGSRWTMHILHLLMGGPRRFGQLQETLRPISPKTLSIRLKELEKQGIIKKKIYAQVPPKVEYSLTQKGLSLQKIFMLISKWDGQTA